MNPLVSVILPIYNVEKYLPDCIESVLAQTYGNLEVILVDDGARDSSPDICDAYAKQDDRIRVIHQKNAGLSSARNSGLHAAGGEYLYFLDSDDCIHPQLIEIAVDTALEKQVRLVQIELQSVPEDFKLKEFGLPEKYRVFEFDRIQSLYNLDQDNQEYAKDIRLTTTVIWSKLYHKSIFDKLEFVDGIRIHEDQMIVHRLLAEANGMCFVELPLYYYRSNEGSLIRSKWGAEKLIILDCYRDRLECVTNLKEDIGDKQSLVNLIYRRYLICIIKNYIKVLECLEGTEKTDNLHRLTVRFREEFHRRCGALTVADRLMFSAFAACPGLCARVYPNR